MSERKKILFISHDASRSGAPILLLHFIEALRAKMPGCDIDIILPVGGPLVTEFEKCGRVLLLNPGGRPGLIAKIIDRLSAGKWSKQSRQQKVKRFLKENYDHIICNTIINGGVLEYVRGHSKNISTYVHELNFTITNFVSKDDLHRTLTLSDHFFVPSQIVADNLVANHNVDKNKISLLRYYIPGIDTHILKAEKDADTGFIVGSSGSSGWRKGFDLFVQLAIILRKECLEKNIRFLWVGVDRNTFEFKAAWHDIVNANIESLFIFIDSTPDVEKHLQQMDVFVMLSREDPYPVAVLEAALNRKPILCFENSGGATDFLMDDCGVIVPYLELNTMANEIMKLISDPQKRSEYGERAFNELRKRHTAAGSVEVLLNYINNHTA